MQTFITDSSDGWGIENLDSKRLNKQLLEGRQILNVLITLRNDPSSTPAWRNHPAVRMWDGCEMMLAYYLAHCVQELKNRDIATDKNWDAIIEMISSNDVNDSINVWPTWHKDPVQLDRIITTHRASLYNKDPDYYAEFKYEAGWVDKHRDAAVCCTGTKKVCNYYWPTHEGA